MITTNINIENLCYCLGLKKERAELLQNNACWAIGFQDKTSWDSKINGELIIVKSINDSKMNSKFFNLPIKGIPVSKIHNNSSLYAYYRIIPLSKDEVYNAIYKYFNKEEIVSDNMISKNNFLAIINEGVGIVKYSLNQELMPAYSYPPKVAYASSHELSYLLFPELVKFKPLFSMDHLKYIDYLSDKVDSKTIGELRVLNVSNDYECFSDENALKQMVFNI